MTVSQESELVGFDADAAVEAARALLGDQVHLCVEYTARDFHVLYADDETLARYDDRADMEAHFDTLHSYVNVDFTEMTLFEELVAEAGEVDAFATYMDRLTLLRVLPDDREGLFLSLAPGAPVTQTVQAVRGALS